MSNHALRVDVQRPFANMRRLAVEKMLVVAEPLDGVEGRRGIVVFATPGVGVAVTYAATDPAIINGENVAGYQSCLRQPG